ncbi:fuconate dehydratase [Babesia caballi]|uniref:Fuconate dehydratase n=1 Tax=Babesia caballi TaxID=5871 RepID=A0AAV4LVB1_BABCB|nr:fuconate dehydratase [Babesia caballi]
MVDPGLRLLLHGEVAQIRRERNELRLSQYVLQVDVGAVVHGVEQAPEVPRVYENGPPAGYLAAQPGEGVEDEVAPVQQLLHELRGEELREAYGELVVVKVDEDLREAGDGLPKHGLTQTHTTLRHRLAGPVFRNLRPVPGDELRAHVDAPFLAGLARPSVVGSLARAHQPLLHGVDVNPKVLVFAKHGKVQVLFPAVLHTRILHLPHHEAQGQLLKHRKAVEGRQRVHDARRLLHRHGNVGDLKRHTAQPRVFERLGRGNPLPGVLHQ